MKRVTAHVAAAFVIAMLAVTAFATVTVFAEDKPGNPGHHYGEISNPGHHYGQLKHKHTPTPTPSPNPGPSTNPTSNPGTHPGSSGPSNQLAGANPGGDSSTSAPSGVQDPVLGLPSQTQPSGQVTFANASSGDALWWLILLVLPALLVVWLLALAMIARTLEKGRRAQAAATATA